MVWYHVRVLHLYSSCSYSLLRSLSNQKVQRVGSVQVHQSQTSKLLTLISRAE